MIGVPNRAGGPGVAATRMVATPDFHCAGGILTNAEAIFHMCFNPGLWI